MSGLGYTRNYSPTGTPTWETAITMDGQIVANFITAGTMSADRIRGGTLVSTNGNVNFDLRNGTLTMNAGSINIAKKFIVDANGNLTANSAAVKGTFFAGSNENDQYWVQLTADGKLTGGKGSNNYGYIDYSAKVRHVDTGTYDYGIKMASDWLYLQHEGISVREHNSDSGSNALRCADRSLTVVTSITENADHTLSWTTVDLKFIHGFLVTQENT
jgi:hypothetical protein